MLKETLDRMEKDAKVGASKPRDVLNLIKKHREVLDWEETSFTEVESVIAETGELEGLINVVQGFPASTIEGLKLCRSLAEENEKLRGTLEKRTKERDTARSKTKKALKQVRALQADLDSARKIATDSSEQSPSEGS